MNTYLPSILSDAPIQAQAMPIELFVELWMQALGDRAADMRKDGGLMLCARLHAEYLDSRTGDELLQNMHMGYGGSLSNDRVLDAGYCLPSYYERGENNVESCSRHNGTPSEVLAAFLASPAHHDHLIGVGGFSSHTVYGIGNCQADWVIVICPPEES